MPQLTILPHAEFCPKGAVFNVPAGALLCDALHRHGVHLEHACEKSCACTTCHVIVREGAGALEAASEQEDDLLDRAWGLAPGSRLACQVHLADENLVVEIPRYSINQVKEGD